MVLFTPSDNQKINPNGGTEESSVNINIPSYIFYYSTINNTLLYSTIKIHYSLLPFLFDWLKKSWEIAEEVSTNCTHYTYYITLMAKCTCARLHHLLKLLPTVLLSCTNSSNTGWFHIQTCVCTFLGCDLPIQLVLKSLSSEYDDRLENHFIMYWFRSQTTNM